MSESRPAHVRMYRRLTGMISMSLDCSGPLMSIRSIALVAFSVGLSLSSVPASAASDGHLHGVIQVAVGELQACALLQDTTVACWGRNADGELGNPAEPEFNTVPILVYASKTTLLSGVVSVTAAGFFTCALQN